MELRRWESETRIFDFIKRVDKGRITTVNDFQIVDGGNSTFVNAF